MGLVKHLLGVSVGLIDSVFFTSCFMALQFAKAFRLRLEKKQTHMYKAFVQQACLPSFW